MSSYRIRLSPTQTVEPDDCTAARAPAEENAVYGAVS
jgi:hypothetical protein